MKTPAAAGALLFCIATSAGAAPPPAGPVNLLGLRGMNAGVQDALNGYANVMSQFPGMTMLRLNCVPGQDSASSIAQVVQEYTSSGVTVEVEDHSGVGNNTAWYSQMAGQFKGNPLVLLETPNEPQGSVSSDQAAIIGAIRGAGFTNPIGVQPAGGWDLSTVGPTVAAVGGTAGLFVTPHIYYNGADPNGAVNYVQSDIQAVQGMGMIPVIDEFGNAMDGFTMDPQGNAVILAVLAANEGSHGGTITAGAAFWAMDNDNHPDGADSVCLTPDCSQLTASTGAQMIQPWLFTANKPSPSVVAAGTTKATAGLVTQTDTEQQQIGKIQASIQSVVTPPPTPSTPTPPSTPTSIVPVTPSAAVQAALSQIKDEIAQVEAQIAALQQQTPPAPEPIGAVAAPAVTRQVVQPVATVQPAASSTEGGGTGGGSAGASADSSSSGAGGDSAEASGGGDTGGGDEGDGGGGGDD